jgi:hypothetical protein
MMLTIQVCGDLRLWYQSAHAPRSGDIITHKASRYEVTSVDWLISVGQDDDDVSMVALTTREVR